MQIQKIPGDFSVCQVRDYTQVDLNAPYCFTGKTEDENSLVCLTGSVPANVTAREDGWKAFCLSGVLDFSLLGVLAGIASILSENGISIFAVSTYNTDHIFTKKENYEKTPAVLHKSGYDAAE